MKKRKPKSRAKSVRLIDLLVRDPYRAGTWNFSNEFPQLWDEVAGNYTGGLLEIAWMVSDEIIDIFDQDTG